MKVREALDILNSLDPDQEVTIKIEGVKYKIPTAPPQVSNQPTQPQFYHDWVVGKEFWPDRSTVTCKLH